MAMGLIAMGRLSPDRLITVQTQGPVYKEGPKAGKMTKAITAFEEKKIPLFYTVQWTLKLYNNMQCIVLKTY